MGIYNTFDYGDGTKYGEGAKLGYTAEPLYATAIGNTTYEQPIIVDALGTIGTGYVIRPRVDLHWTAPQGSIFGIRVVRNQEGWSEHEEDGVIVFESFDAETIVNTDTAIDQLAPSPLMQGRYAYYTVWILLADFSWAIAAQSYCLVPQEHYVPAPNGGIYKSSERKFLDIIPKVYTSEQQSYVDEVSEKSDLRAFIGGFAYTLDEIQTFADLLVPDISGKSSNPNTVALQASQMGLPKEPTLSLQRKKALIRNGLLMNKRRGTVNGSTILSKSLTGYAAYNSVSPNLLLSLQDCTFYKGVGNWVASSGGTLTSNLTTGSSDLPYQSQMFSVDRAYTGKLVTASSNVVLSLGKTTPILTAIPVGQSTDYYFSYYIKDGGGNVTPTITWYDMTGASISTTVGTAAAATSTWTKVELSATSPSTAYYAAVELKFATAGTYYVDMFQFAVASLDTHTYYREARALDVRLSPSKVNYIGNPSMINPGLVEPIYPWAGGGFSTQDWTNNSTLPGIKLDGTKMFRGTTISSTSFYLTMDTVGGVKSGGYYTFSIYASTVSGTQPATFTLEAVDGAGSVMVSTNGSLASRSTGTVNVTTTWTRQSVSVFVPESNDAGIYLRVTVSGVGTGALLNLDAAQVEEGYVATDYFDGSYTARGAYWLGTANDSISVMYRNKPPKIDRLMSELPEFMPLNTAFTITSGFNDTIVLENSGVSS